MSKDIDGIRAASGSYYRWALMARKRYLLLLQQTDRTIADLYLASVKRLLAEFRAGRNKGLRFLLEAVSEDVTQLNVDLGKSIDAAISNGVEAGMVFSKSVSLDVLKKAEIQTEPMIRAYEFQRKRAVAMSYARSYKDGLKLSQRIWNVTEGNKKVLADIVRAGVGEDAVTVAKAMQTYVKSGSTRMAAEYPGMIKRMGSRIPLNLDYNALRLARTELTAAYGEGTLAGAKASPAIGKVRWVLSSSHPRPDICDTYAEGGEGHGVYSVDDCPPYPAHPNCLCTLQPEPEDTGDLIKRLKQWRSAPGSQPDIESWYQQNYRMFE